MRYFKLLDQMNYGEIIKVEGRQQYTYIHGEGVWEKTGILLLYLTEEETGFYEKYEEISEEQAFEALKQTDALYQKLETTAEERLKKMNGTVPEIHTKNMEIKIIYLLYCISRARRLKRIKIEELREDGFTQRMLVVLKVLMENGKLSNDCQLDNVIHDTFAMLVKYEDILQNGEKNKRDKFIIEKKLEHDNLVKC